MFFKYGGEECSRLRILGSSEFGVLFVKIDARSQSRTQLVLVIRTLRTIVSLERIRVV